MLLTERCWLTAQPHLEALDLGGLHERVVVLKRLALGSLVVERAVVCLCVSVLAAEDGVGVALAGKSCQSALRCERKSAQARGQLSNHTITAHAIQHVTRCAKHRLRLRLALRRGQQLSGQMTGRTLVALSCTATSAACLPSCCTQGSVWMKGPWGLGRLRGWMRQGQLALGPPRERPRPVPKVLEHW